MYSLILLSSVKSARVSCLLTDLCIDSLCLWRRHTILIQGGNNLSSAFDNCVQCACMGSCASVHVSQLCVCVCARARVPACVCACVRVYVSVFVCACMCMCEQVGAYKRVRQCVRQPVCVGVSVRVCIITHRNQTAR